MVLSVLATSSDLITLISPNTIVVKKWFKAFVKATKRCLGLAFAQPKTMLMNELVHINLMWNMIHTIGFRIPRGLESGINA